MTLVAGLGKRAAGDVDYTTDYTPNGFGSRADSPRRHKRPRLLRDESPPAQRRSFGNIQSFLDFVKRAVRPRPPLAPQARAAPSTSKLLELRNRSVGLQARLDQQRLETGKAPGHSSSIVRQHQSSQRTPFSTKTPSGLPRPHTRVGMSSGWPRRQTNETTSTGKSALREADEHNETPYQKQVREWKWQVQNAKAAGQVAPAAPARPTLTTNGLPRVTSGEWRKKQPMGHDKHKRQIQRRDQDRTTRLVEEACLTTESRAQKASLDEYRAMVARTMSQDALQASTAFHRPSIFRKASGSSKPKPARSASDMRQVIDTFRAVSSTPQPKINLFNYEQMQEKLRQMDIEAEEKLGAPKKRKRLFPSKLSADDQDKVDDVFSDRSFSSKIDGASVEYKDIVRLRGLQWLNDEIITFYAQMLNMRAAAAEADADANGAKDTGEPGMKLKKLHAFNSFFYTSLSQGGHKKVKRWTRKVDLFAKDIVIIPINLGNAHWVCAAINIRDKRFEYYDSLGGSNPAVFQRLREYLAEEHKLRKGTELDLSDWQDFEDEDVPLQENSSDCGVFTSQFMECLSREVDGFDFDQRQMKYFRQKIALELAEKRLIPEKKWVDA